MEEIKTGKFILNYILNNAIIVYGGKEDLKNLLERNEKRYIEAYGESSMGFISLGDIYGYDVMSENSGRQIYVINDGEVPNDVREKIRVETIEDLLDELDEKGE